MLQQPVSSRRVFAVVGAIAGASGLAWAAPALAQDKPPPPEPQLLAVGSPAPDFSAEAHDGKKIQLAKLKGKFVVVYFYPADDTPGCTKEACSFRDNWEKVQKAGVVVLGVSTQDNTSHKAFAEKHKLPFQLLPDEKGEIAKKFGVPVVNGKARRITYLVGKDGKIRHVWGKVATETHATDILAQIEAK
jgi:peroxiredoxin Q/BCP